MEITKAQLIKLIREEIRLLEGYMGKVYSIEYNIFVPKKIDETSLIEWLTAQQRKATLGMDWYEYRTTKRGSYISVMFVDASEGKSFELAARKFGIKIHNSY